MDTLWGVFTMVPVWLVHQMTHSSWWIKSTPHWQFIPRKMIQCIICIIHSMLCIWVLWPDIKHILVWTLCLMHRCVCIWRYILQNYNYKLHFQNLFIYDIPHVSIGTLAAENLDVCTACDPWDSNIQLTMGIDWRWQIYPNVVQLVSK